MEKDVTIRCKRNDSDLVQQLILEAVERYKTELKQKDIKVSPDDKNFQPDDSLVSFL